MPTPEEIANAVWNRAIGPDDGKLPAKKLLRQTWERTADIKRLVKDGDLTDAEIAELAAAVQDEADRRARERLGG